MTYFIIYLNHLKEPMYEVNKLDFIKVYKINICLTESMKSTLLML